MFELVETFPGFRIADKDTIGEYHRRIGSSYGPHELRKSWVSVWIGNDKLEHADYSFHLENGDGNDPAIFAAAVLCLLRIWKRNMKVIVGSPHGVSRSVVVLAASLGIDHGIAFTSALWILQAIYEKADPHPELIRLGEKFSEEWQNQNFIIS